MSHTAEAASAGAIYDIGYRRYEGGRLGRGYAFRTLFSHSLRAAFGINRGGRALVAPWALFGLAVLPALVQAVIGALSGGEAQLVDYHDYFSPVHMILALFCAGQAPELVSTDQRHQVLPLYFSRALRRGDYALARLAAMVAAVFLLAFTPLLVMLVGRLAAAADFRAALRAEAPAVLPILAGSLVAAVVLGGLALAVASLTGRRAYATAGIIGLLMLTAPVAAILTHTASGEVARYAVLLNPINVVSGAIHALFGRPPDANSMLGAAALPGAAFAAGVLVLAAGSTALLLARYRRIRA
jgi:ABC-2 type transport system permease protein